MKYVLAFLLFLNYGNTIAQLKYNNFFVNKLAGVLDIHTLNEVLPPNYKEIRNMFYECFAYQFGDSVKVISRIDATQNDYLLASNNFTIRDKYFKGLHIIKDNNSAIIKNCGVISTANYLYQKIITTTDQLLGIRKDNIDILDISEKEMGIKKTFNANAITQYYYDDLSAYRYILYGKNESYIIDKKGNILTTKKIKINDEQEASELLLRLFPDNSTKKQEAYGVGYNDWDLYTQKDGYKYYTNENDRKKYAIKINATFDIHLDYNENNMIIVSNPNTKDEYKFYIDEYALNALIPEKYQRIFDISFISVKYDEIGTFTHPPKLATNLDSFINKNLKIPKKAIRANINDAVFIECTINEMGKITATNILKSIDKDCDEAALKMVQKLPAFLPAVIIDRNIIGEENIKQIKGKIKLRIPFKTKNILN